MSIPLIFSVFSRRDKSASNPRKRLTDGFRHRILQLCVESFSGYREFPNTPGISIFWSEIHSTLRYFHGRPILSNQGSTVEADDAVGFLLECSDEHFLDFVEMIFQASILWSALTREALENLVSNINVFLRVDDLPYALTKIAYASEGRQRSTAGRLAALPKIIRRENEVLHQTAIEPALTLLTNPAFASANEEFLDALEDYRRGKYEDCVTKCASSLESVMKIICDSKKWPHQQTDKASKLANIILPRTGLAPSLKHPIIVVATLRNQFSSAHGAGTQPRVVPQHLARFAINATASVILLLVEVTNP